MNGANKTPQSTNTRLLIDINKYLTEECGDANSVYYSVENNTIGEAALQSVAEIGEENIPHILRNPSTWQQ